MRLVYADFRDLLTVEFLYQSGFVSKTVTRLQIVINSMTKKSGYRLKKLIKKFMDSRLKIFESICKTVPCHKV